MGDRGESEEHHDHQDHADDVGPDLGAVTEVGREEPHGRELESHDREAREQRDGADQGEPEANTAGELAGNHVHQPRHIRRREQGAHAHRVIERHHSERHLAPRVAVLRDVRDRGRALGAVGARRARDRLDHQDQDGACDQRRRDRRQPL